MVTPRPPFTIETFVNERVAKFPNGEGVNLDENQYICSCRTFGLGAIRNPYYICKHVAAVAAVDLNEVLRSRMVLYFPFRTALKMRRGVTLTVSTYLTVEPPYSPLVTRPADGTSSFTFGFMPVSWDDDKIMYSRRTAAVIAFQCLVGWGQTMECEDHGLDCVPKPPTPLGAWDFAIRGADVMNTGACFDSPDDLLPED